MNQQNYTYREFIDTASHELQAPLRKLSVFIERLSDVCKDEKTEESANYITRIHSCLAEMRSLVDGLTQWSGVYQQELKPVPCDVDLIARELLSEMKEDLDNKQAKIQYKDLPVLIGDRDQLKLLFKSLLSNAVKFHKPDEPLQLEISGEKLSGDFSNSNGLNPTMTYSRIRIQDNGIGLKPGQEKGLFRPFGRLNGKSEYPGNGLGLALCKTIVDNHAGLLYGKGDEEGACFEVILPQMPA